MRSLSLLCLALLWAGCPTAGGDDDDSAVDAGPDEGTFTALTYNVHGLPPEITGDDTAARMVQIAPLLDDYDVAALQEDFDADNHATLDAAAHHATRRWFDDVLEGRYYGSGLALFADVAEVDYATEHYPECLGTLDDGSDCLASKGFQLLRVELAPGVELDVYNTHLEAGGGEDNDQVRMGQVDQLIASMNDRSAGRAILFLGDTNLHPDEAQDIPVLDDWFAQTGLRCACEVAGGDEPDHIDRLLFRGSDTLSITATDWVNEPGFLDGDGVPLSDHPALSATFAWQRLGDG